MPFPVVDPAYLRRHWQAFAVLTLALVVFWRYPQIDFAITDGFFDVQTKRFAIKNAWFWSTVMHDGVSKVSKIAQLLALVALLASWWVHWLKPWRLALAYFVVASLGSVAIVNVLKESSGRACPDDLIRYGGSIEFTALFSGVTEMAGNRCWPGGHILHALALLPLPFALHGLGRVRAARNALLGIAVFALLLNYTQIARGQHFLSHHLWTWWICWLGSLGSFSLLGLWRARRTRRAATLAAH